MKNSWKRALALGISAVMVFPAGAMASSSSTSIHAEDVKQFQQAAKSASLPGNEAKKKVEMYKANKEMEEFINSNTFVIKYNKPIAKQVHKKAGVKLVRSLPRLGYDVIYIPKSKKFNDVLKVYQNEKTVESISPSVKYKQFAPALGDPKKSKMYHLPMLNIDQAIKQAGKHKVTVAVVDGGVDYKHPDLQGQLLPPYNAADPSKTPARDMHGTHVAGIIASKANNGLGGYGVNPNAKILPVDVFNGKAGANDYTIAEGILYAVSKKVDVINLSLGGFGSSPLVEDAIQQAIDAGIVVVAAAGNESTDVYAYPAAYPGVISVGNVDRDKMLSDSSNFGPSVDVVAPGEDIYNTGYELGKGSSYATLTGTSMASPMVAGVASLLKSKYPNLTSYDVENILEKTATDLGAKGYDTKFANGLINPVAALKLDPKSLPAQPDYSEEAVLKTAKPLKNGENSFTGNIQSPGEVHWYKVDLNENEHVQTVLEGADSYDYGMEFYFIPEGAEEGVFIEHNKSRAGEKEAYLYTAAEKGTLVIGVKDVNDNYHRAGQSTYTLTANTITALQADADTSENPVEITSFPYAKGDFTLFPAEPEMPDHDYFTFAVDEPKVLSISLSDIPGVNAALSVSMVVDEDGGEEEVVMANDNGPSKGEVLSFKAVPGVDYKITVTNEAAMMDGDMGSILALLGMGGGSIDLGPATTSAFPYQFKVEERQLPADEDGWPIAEDLEESLENGTIDPQTYAEEKAEDQADFTENMIDEEYNIDKEILEKSIPYTLGKEQSGYFQVEGDEDYYKFVPTTSGVYELDIVKGSSQMPMGTILQYNEDIDALLPVTEGGDDILGMILALLGGGQQTNKTTVALKAGEEYVLRVANSTYNISGDPYTIRTKKIADVPKESDTDQNSQEKAANIKQGTTYKNYFIHTGDVDYYYFKNGEAEKIHRLSIKPSNVTAAQKATIPYDLRQPMIFSGMLIEDTNGDKMIDEEEALKQVPFGPSLFEMNFEPTVDLAFKAKKHTGYFVEVRSLMSAQPNLLPYEVKLSEMKSSLRDGDGKVVNHVPQKPIALKKAKDHLYVNGYMNAEIPFGDVDHFALNVAKDKRYDITLQMESGLDGKVEIYNEKGARVASFDHYGSGDEEIASINLKKGKYFIEVSETQGRASAQSYKLTVK
ncbi:S8 family peptidase [Bacillus sp. FJAT-42315]|uniref:S8 family peptidase n=1 Tax=Bacillus sp. FJAT-42315 TaxID=2014077 RepID=UPI0012FF2C0F|nr:S8 family serine peptidase [Bacillus sp. FJAT-42315]